MDEHNEYYAISLVTGEIFKIIKDDIKTLFKYQIPLKSKPTGNCKKCYGRGYIGIDPTNRLHRLCTCINKHILDNYDLKNVIVEMPRLS